MGPYLLLVRALAVIVAVSSLIFGWHALTGHYIDIGIARQQALDAKATLVATEAVRAQESLHAVKQAAIDNKLYEETQDEIQARDTAIAALRSDNRRLRSITGKIDHPNDVPYAVAAASSSDESCTVQLPPEIGRSFQKLREAHIRINSDANKAADALRACQAELLLDRKTCGVK